MVRFRLPEKSSAGPRCRLIFLLCYRYTCFLQFKEILKNLVSKTDSVQSTYLSLTPQIWAKTCVTVTQHDYFAQRRTEAGKYPLSSGDGVYQELF